VQIDGAKMAKSAGNFILLKDAIAEYSADSTRLALADSGDSLDDANFVRDTATGFIFKLTTFIDAVKTRFAKLGEMRIGEMTLFDRIFENVVNRAILKADSEYQRMCFKQVLNTVFYELQAEEMQYELQSGGRVENLHAGVMKRYFETALVLLMPLAPHTAEYLWQDVLGKPTSVMQELFPKPTSDKVDIKMLFAQKLISDVTHDIAKEVNRIKKKFPDTSEVFIYVAQSYAEWQREGLKALLALYREKKGELPKDAIKQLVSQKPAWAEAQKMQEIMAFLAFAKSNAEKYESEAALWPSPVIDDLAVLQEARAFISAQTGLKRVTPRAAEAGEAPPEHAGLSGKARPGQPQIAFPPPPPDTKKN
jgi:leucyl-tRNA synthetase